MDPLYHSFYITTAMSSFSDRLLAEQARREFLEQSLAHRHATPRTDAQRRAHELEATYLAAQHANLYRPETLFSPVPGFGSRAAQARVAYYKAALLARAPTGVYPRPPPNEEGEFEVERLTHYYQMPSGEYFYRVQWKGYAPEESTWQHETDIPSGMKGKQRPTDSIHPGTLFVGPELDAAVELPL